MEIRKKLFAKTEKVDEANKKENNEKNNPEYVNDRAIVAGSLVSALGATSVAGKKYFLKNKVKGVGEREAIKLGRIGKILIPTGLVIAAAGGYKKYKNKKSKKNENKA
jgi:hypothetical protein